MLVTHAHLASGTIQSPKSKNLVSTVGDSQVIASLSFLQQQQINITSEFVG